MFQPFIQNLFVYNLFFVTLFFCLTQIYGYAVCVNQIRISIFFKLAELLHNLSKYALAAAEVPPGHVPLLRLDSARSGYENGNASVKCPKKVFIECLVRFVVLFPYIIRYFLI